MLVEKVMEKDFPTISSSKTIRDAIETFRKHNTGALAVMRNGRFIGMLSQRDVLRYIRIQLPKRYLVMPAPFDLLEAFLNYHLQDIEFAEEAERFKRKTLVYALAGRPRYVKPRDHISKASAIMLRYNTDYVPVLKAKKLVGVVSADAILAAML